MRKAQLLTAVPRLRFKISEFDAIAVEMAETATRRYGDPAARTDVAVSEREG